MPFITPAELPPTSYCRRLLIPNTPEWHGIISGLLLDLIYPSNWVSDGGVDPQVAADAMYQMLLAFWASNCDEDVMDIRQSPTNPCILEKTYDGATWEPWADLSLCVPEMRTDPATGKIQLSGDGGATWETVPDAPWPTAPGVPYAPEPTPQNGADDAAKRCNAAANAALGISELYRETFGAIGAGIMNNIIGLNYFMRDVNRTLFDLLYQDEYALIQAEDIASNYDSQYWQAPALDTAAMEALTCLLYDNATADAEGVVTFNYGAVVDNVIADLGVNPGTAVTLLLGYMAAPGLNSAGSIKAITNADCLCDDPVATYYRLGGDGTANMTAEFTNYDAVNDWYVGQYRPEVYRVALPWIHINAQTPILGIYVELEWENLIAGGNFSLRPGQRLATPEYTQAITGTGSWSGWFMFANPSTYASCTIEGKVSNSSVGQVYIKKFNILT